MKNPSTNTGAIRSVHVRRVPGGTYYACREDHAGWRCGRCLRGNLGPTPKKRQKCRVCKSFVSIVAKAGDKPWLESRPVEVVFPGGETLVYR